MSDGFPHPSRPGFYGLQLQPQLASYLGVLADALIPGTATCPSGREAQVVDFIRDRASQNDIDLLDQLSHLWPAAGADQAKAALETMERDDPISFAYLRELVYHGYYSSRRVLAVMADRGHGYHGAPQPLGYQIQDVMSRPTKARGSYIATGDVQHVSH